MKLLRISGEKFELEIKPKEKDLLLRMLKLYPLVPDTHHELSKGRRIPDQEENQHLLNEALKAQRLANKKQVLALLDEPGRFIPVRSGFQVGFKRDEIEWLLQVLNDVRIGSWIALGSPGYGEGMKPLRGPKSFQRAMAMEITGAFQAYFLQIVNGDIAPEPT